MPDTRVPADAVRLPITRRSLFAAAASLTLAPAAARPTQEPELTALGRRFEQALAVLDAAQRALQDCERRYLEEGPMPPPVLISGALGKLLPEGSWWRARELRALLNDKSRRALWPAARAALPAALAYEARDRRFARKLGVRAAERAERAAHDAVEALADAILAAPARSDAGLAVQGRAVKVFGKPEWWSSEPSHADACERLSALLIDRAIAPQSSMDCRLCRLLRPA